MRVWLAASGRELRPPLALMLPAPAKRAGTSIMLEGFCLAAPQQLRTFLYLPSLPCTSGQAYQPQL